MWFVSMMQNVVFALVRWESAGRIHRLKRVQRKVIEVDVLMGLVVDERARQHVPVGAGVGVDALVHLLSTSLPVLCATPHLKSSTAIVPIESRKTRWSGCYRLGNRHDVAGWQWRQVRKLV